MASVVASGTTSVAWQARRVWRVWRMWQVASGEGWVSHMIGTTPAPSSTPFPSELISTTFLLPSKKRGFGRTMWAPMSTNTLERVHRSVAQQWHTPDQFSTFDQSPLRRARAGGEVSSAWCLVLIKTRGMNGLAKPRWSAGVSSHFSQSVVSVQVRYACVLRVRTATDLPVATGVEAEGLPATRRRVARA